MPTVWKRSLIVIRFIFFSSCALGIMEMIFIAMVLLNISLPSPKNISGFYAADGTRQQTQLMVMEKDNKEPQAEKVVWLDIKANHR
jgi:hypothetical protein